jgi:hypothetical protein
MLRGSCKSSEMPCRLRPTPGSELCSCFFLATFVILCIRPLYAAFPLLQRVPTPTLAPPALNRTAMWPTSYWASKAKPVAPKQT